MNAHPMNARDLALDSICNSKLPGWTRAARKPAPGARGGVDTRDYALGESIAATVVRNQMLLRYLIKHYSGREHKNIDPLVQVVLAIGLAQLRFFDRIPASAAVDEAVEQTKRLKLGRASGFVNAVLRRAAREPDVALPPRDNTEQYVQIVLSHPLELFTRLTEVMGKENALKLCERHNQQAPTIVRTSDISALAGSDVKVRSHSEPGMAVVENAREADFARWAAAGLAQVQDPTSAKVVRRMELNEGARALDRCCGLGTKTLQMAEMIGSTGTVVAMDPAEPRIKRLKESLAKRNLGWVHPHVAGMMSDFMTETDKPFNRVLIDAPCSNSGVLMRRPEARYRQDLRSLKSLQELQRRILLDTLPHIRQGGILVYSTCSIWHEENGDQIQWLCNQTPDFEVATLQTTLPSINDDATRHHDGGFVAVLKRKKVSS